MRLTIERDPLLKALGHVGSVVAGGKNVIPILANLMLQAEGGELRLVGSDLNVENAERVPCDVKADGSLTVPASLFADLVRNLSPGADIELRAEPDKHRLAVVCGRTKASLPTLPAGDFPTLGAPVGSKGGQIPAADLARLLDKVRFAAGSEATRYYLMGVHLVVVTVDGELRLRGVATDGHRLALAEIPAPASFAAFPSIIVPSKTADEIRKLIDGAEYVELQADGAKIRVIADQALLTSKLIEGNYPDYERVIPTEHPHQLQLDVTDLLAGLKRTMIAADGKSKSLRLEIAPAAVAGADDDQARLGGRSMEAGEVQETLACSFSGPAMTLGFNGRYLVDIVNRTDGENLHLQIGGTADPILIRDPADARVRFVLMPQRA